MINIQTQAILLLTSYFSKSVKADVKPLSPTEWGRFAPWLHKQGYEPAMLVTGDPRDVLRNWTDPKVPIERIEQLLSRGHSLALALEKWSRAGIWVLTRSDAEYPKSLKLHLGATAPPVLFGCGNARLLNQTGISVVGSRKASESDLRYTDELGQRVAGSGLSVVSGGARGIDEAAMLGALRNEGTVVGVMADSLLQAATASKWRQGLMSNSLVLISPFYPEAGFNVGNAMSRNKYIYCLSKAAVVVHSGREGGTWNGALENLKKAWVPLWVKSTDDPEAGNSSLVSRGGRRLEESPDSLYVQDLISRPYSAPLLSSDFAEGLGGTLALTEEKQNPVKLPCVLPALATALEEYDDERSTRQAEREQSGIINLADISFYEFFLIKLEKHGQSVTIGEMAELWELPKSLIQTWVKQAMAENRVEKLSKPVRYQLASQVPLKMA